MDSANPDDRTPKREGTTVERVSDREILIEHTFDAPAHLIFEAWANPELFARWWVPRSFPVTLQSCELDVRAGGTYRLSFGGGRDFFGRYLEVAPPTRIVWTNEEGGPDGPITTVTLTERDGKTHLVVSELHPSKEALDADGGGATEGMPETLAQLEELLAELASPQP